MIRTARRSSSRKARRRRVLEAALVLDSIGPRDAARSALSNCKEQTRNRARAERAGAPACERPQFGGGGCRKGRSRHSSLGREGSAGKQTLSLVHKPAARSSLAIGRVPPAEGECALAQEQQEGKNERALFFDRASVVVVAVDASTLILSPFVGAYSGLWGRLARAPISIPGLLTGRHLSRAGGKERERGAEESDAGKCHSGKRVL